MSPSIRDILNKHKWHHGDLDSLEISVVHRGAPDDQRTIKGADIRDIGPKGISVGDDFARADWEAELIDEESGDAWIPFHRFLAIRTPSGTAWSKEHSGRVPEQEPGPPDGWHADDGEDGP